jgi:hypothetical protein
MAMVFFVWWRGSGQAIRKTRRERTGWFCVAKEASTPMFILHIMKIMENPQDAISSIASSVVKRLSKVDRMLSGGTSGHDVRVIDCSQHFMLLVLYCNGTLRARTNTSNLLMAATLRYGATGSAVEEVGWEGVQNSVEDLMHPRNSCTELSPYRPGTSTCFKFQLDCLSRDSRKKSIDKCAGLGDRIDSP